MKRTELKRTGIKRKSAKPRTTKTIRCKRQRCSRAVVVGGLCKTHVIDKLDSIVRKRAYADIPSCANCGTERDLQWSHHLSRKFYSVRWDPRNYTCHCRGCHTFLTYNPFAHVEWIKQHIGANEYDALYAVTYGPEAKQFKNTDLISWWERLTK